MSAQIINFTEARQWHIATEKVNVIRKMYGYPPLTDAQLKFQIKQVEEWVNDRRATN